MTAFALLFVLQMLATLVTATAGISVAVALESWTENPLCGFAMGTAAALAAALLAYPMADEIFAAVMEWHSEKVNPRK